MERYNIFQLIHKGLRAALYRTALQLQQTDFTSSDEAEEASDKVREIIMLFDMHAHKEDSYILPAVGTWEPSVVTAFASEHEQDEQLGRELIRCLDRLECAQSPIEKQKAGQGLSEAFSAFIAFNLNHMAKEEDILNKILWRYYSDDEIKAITGKISGATPPWIQEFYATWMLRGINNTEAVTWMKAIEKGAPAIVFQTLLQKAEQEWPAPRFQTVQASLCQIAAI